MQQLLPFVSFCIALMLVALLTLDMNVSTIAMIIVLLTCASMVKERSSPKALIAAGFFVGAASDALMNFVVRQVDSPNPNWSNMVSYFDTVGVLPSLLFAGALTSGMVLNAALFRDFLATPPIVSLIVTGFVSGALWGVWVESLRAKAAEPLMVFYDNTPGGYTENRIWDGLSIVFACLIVEYVFGINVSLSS